MVIKGCKSQYFWWVTLDRFWIKHLLSICAELNFQHFLCWYLLWKKVIQALSVAAETDNWWCNKNLCNFSQARVMLVSFSASRFSSQKFNKFKMFKPKRFTIKIQMKRSNFHQIKDLTKTGRHWWLPLLKMWETKNLFYFSSVNVICNIF